MNDWMRFVSKAILLPGLLLLLAVGAAQAQVPQTLPYQGYLQDDTGTPLNTTATFTFSLWTNPTSADPNDQAWSEIHPAVSVTDGLYTVSLGSLTPFSSQGVDFSSAYWLETRVDEGSGPVVLVPRTPLEAVPYAFHALNAGGAWDLAGNGGTVPGTHFLGTTDAVALEIKVNGERAFRIEPTAVPDAPNMVGGHASNAAVEGVHGATISGGGYDDGTTVYPNEVTGDYGTVGGGQNNAAGQNASVGGGYANTAGGSISTVGGGGGNTASGDYAAIGGGTYNTVTAPHGTIGGGGSLNPAEGNRVTDTGGTIAGGTFNRAGDDVGTINDASYGTVGGGQYNDAARSYATVGGGRSNYVSAPFGTIGGGGSFGAPSGNVVTDEGGTVGGGNDNQAGDNIFFSNDGVYATVGGGLSNTAGDAYATVGGGDSNEAIGNSSSVGGGNDNRAIGSSSTIGGGFSNEAGDEYATVGGGDSNEASGYIATISGGRSNTATGKYATIPGGLLNTAGGEISFAAGRRAQALHNGSFVWGDYTDDDIESTTVNQFVARASGGTYFFSNSAATTGVVLNPGSGSWTSASSVQLKTDFEAIDPGAVLAKVASLPISQWRYKAEADGIRHIGPTAEVFYAVFGLGATDEGITNVDADGVALAAIQGLHALLVEKDARIEALQQQLEALQAQVSLLFQERQP